MATIKEPPSGGTYIKCSCGGWFSPVFEDQTTCMKCRRKARYEECHSHAPKVLVVI